MKLEGRENEDTCGITCFFSWGQAICDVAIRWMMMNYEEWKYK